MSSTLLRRTLAAGIAILGLAAACLTYGSGTSAAAVADGWSAAEMTTLSSLHIGTLAPPPDDRSNRVAGAPQAAALGQRLFADRNFSSNKQVSCASCHLPGSQFQDGLPLAQGVGTGIRRTMPIVGAGHQAWLFWDGRKDSLWAQALGPLEDPREHGGNRLAYVRLLKERYAPEYQALFGPLPDLAGLPQEASPAGSPAQRAAWQSMSEASRNAVSRAFANMGKAIAAFENTLGYGESRVDRYIGGIARGDRSAAQLLNASEKNGLRLFIGKAQCVTCHNGPLLTDFHFHNTGVAPRAGTRPDAGRAAAIDKVQNDEFNCLGPFSDAAPGQCGELEFMETGDPRMQGAFRTASLRNAALRAPYMHAGQIASLDDVLRHYATAPAAAIGTSELKPLQLSEQERADLVHFLQALNSPITENGRPAAH